MPKSTTADSEGRARTDSPSFARPGPTSAPRPSLTTAHGRRDSDDDNDEKRDRSSAPASPEPRRPLPPQTRLSKARLEELEDEAYWREERRRQIMSTAFMSVSPEPYIRADTPTSSLSDIGFGKPGTDGRLWEGPISFGTPSVASVTDNDEQEERVEEKGGSSPPSRGHKGARQGSTSTGPASTAADAREEIATDESRDSKPSSSHTHSTQGATLNVPSDRHRRH